jgi:hypothetical protein
MAPHPTGRTRAGAPEAALPPESPGAGGPRQRQTHSGPLPTRHAVPGPPPPRNKLGAGSSAARSHAGKNPAIQALRELEREVGELPLDLADLAGEASKSAVTRDLIDLALRIAQQRAELPRDEAIRGMPDKKFADIVGMAAIRNEDVVNAATKTYTEAVKAVEEQMAVDTAAYLKHVATHGNSVGKTWHLTCVVRVARAERVAAQAQKHARLTHGLLQDYKEHIALCEATLSTRWTLDPGDMQLVEEALTITKLQRFAALSQQLQNHGKLLLWGCVNPHPEVFAGMEIEELLPVVKKLTTYDAVAIIDRVAGASPGPDLLSAQEKEEMDALRIAAADCAAYMASLADRVDAGSGVTFTGQSDRSIRDLALQHLRGLEETGWELADVAGTLLQPAQAQAAEPLAQETPSPSTKPRSRPKARGKKPSAMRGPVRPAVPAGPTTSPSGEAAPVVRPPVDARQPIAARPLPPAPSARAARARVSRLTALLDAQDPRPAHRRELQQLRKVSTPENIASTLQAHARQWEIRADKILAAHEDLEARHLPLLSGDEFRQASSLKDQAAAMAAELRREAQALTRNLDQVKRDLMKTYLLPKQSHWEELLEAQQAQVPRPPQALPSSPPHTLFEVELQPTPLAGQGSPPPSVWLHVHTHQAADAAKLDALPLQAFAAMHLKSNVERRRGRNWLIEQANKGMPAQLIYRGKVDKRFVDKVLAMGRKTQSAPGASG